MSRAVHDRTDRARPPSGIGRRVRIGIVGGIVLVAGIIMIPYPGPGWLVVFGGLAILAREFTWAERILQYARRRYDAWVAWVGRRHLIVRLVILAFTGLVVVATLWLLNVFGGVAGVFGLPWAWLSTPLW